MVDPIEECSLADDERINVTGRAAIEAVLQLLANQAAAWANPGSLSTAFIKAAFALAVASACGMETPALASWACDSSAYAKAKFESAATSPDSRGRAIW